MNQLLPIIRRKRRPLLPVETVPDVPPAPAGAPTTNRPESVVKLAETVVTKDKRNARDDEAS
jgi:hypothetical protein